jgi:hypothetical protein
MRTEGLPIKTIKFTPGEDTSATVTSTHTILAVIIPVVFNHSIPHGSTTAADGIALIYTLWTNLIRSTHSGNGD